MILIMLMLLTVIMMVEPVIFSTIICHFLCYNLPTLSTDMTLLAVHAIVISITIATIHWQYIYYWRYLHSRCSFNQCCNSSLSFANIKKMTASIWDNQINQKFLHKLNSRSISNSKSPDAKPLRANTAPSAPWHSETRVKKGDAATDKRTERVAERVRHSAQGITSSGYTYSGRVCLGTASSSFRHSRGTCRFARVLIV